MEGVKRGGDRQKLHEVIRSASMEATAAMKRGEKCELLSKLAATGEFPMTEEEMNALLDPALYTGRCAEQVSRYIAEITPFFEGASEDGADIAI